MLSTISLLSLLPLLALVSAFPSGQPRFVPRQTTGNGTTSADVSGGATPLSFQSVGDAGISAQMVCPFFPVRSMTDDRCGLETRTKSTSSTRQRTTQLLLMVNSVLIPLGLLSMISNPTLVSSPFENDEEVSL